MNYELAKELMMTGKFNDPALEPMDMGGGEYLPTDLNNKPIGLSELIEACGGGFTSLDRIKAHGDYETVFLCELTTGGAVMGHSPEEAVARLWLVLNKK